MRLILTLILLTVSTLGLSACYKHSQPNHPHANGNFCPPGQAKKGRC
jgi:hypothetical protein